MSAKYKSPSFLLPNEINTNTNPLNTDGNPATGTGVNSLYSINFDSSNSDYIDVGTISSLNTTQNFSISLWFNEKVRRYTSTLFSSGTGSGNLISVSSRNGTLNIYVGNSGYQSIASVSLNTWYHVVLTVENTTAKVYINNGSPTTVTVGSINSSSGTLAKIGALSFTSGYTFDGQIDEVAIFNRALDSTEIAALYEGTGSNIRPSNLMATDLNPLAYYPLGEQAQNSGKLPDTSTNEWQFPNGVLQDYVMDFDGSASSAADFINTSNTSIGNIGSNPHTFSAWINIADHGQVQTILSNKNSNGWKFEVSSGASPDNITFYISGTNLLRATFPSSSYGSWINAVAVINGSSSKIYINGVNQSASVTGTLIPPDSTEPLIIGAQDNGSGTYIRSLNGQMSNVQIFSSALPATGSNSVQTLYNNGSPLTSMSGFTSLTNWWKLNATSVYTPSAPNYTKALDFGGSQSVDTNYTGLDGLSKATISLWVRPDTASASGWIFNARDSSNVGMNCQFFTSKTYLYFTGPINIISANYTPPFSDNLWVNLVIVFDGALTGNDRIKLYANGETKVIDTYNGTIPAVLPTSSTSLKIAESLNGQVSNFAIFNSALTSSQVSTLFNFGTPETNISFSPQAWWKLDDQTAITDSSGYGNTGTNNGATDISSGVAVTPSWKIPDASGTVNGVSTTLPSTALQQSDLQFDSPYSNYSLSFDGTTSITCDSIPALTSSTNFSISGWLKQTTLDQTRFMLGARSSSTDAVFLYTYNDGKMYVDISNGSSTYGYFDYSTVISANTWFHVAVVFDGAGSANADKLKLYINGSLITLTYYGTIPSSTTSSTNDFKIGIVNGYTDEWLGSIDETSIFNYNLSEAQVLEMYNNGRPKDLTTFSGTAPTSWWRLGENAYFQDSTLVLPNSITGAPNGEASTNNLEMISADAPGTYANGIGKNLDILDRVGDAALSTANSQSYNMIPSDISPYVPQYIGDQIANNFSMTFDGTNYFDIETGLKSTFDAATKASVSLWFKASSISSTVPGILFQQESTDAGDNWLFVIRFSTTGQLQTGIKVGSSYPIATYTTSVNTGNWYNVVSVYDGSTLKLYLNGAKVAENLSTGSPLATSSSSAKAMIGATAVPSRYFNGQIDEVAIFDTALNAGQIYNDIYQPTSTGTNQTADLENNPNLPNPVAWYRMGD